MATTDTRFAQEGSAEAGVIWDRLEDQLGWYSDRSRSAKRAYKRSKVAQLLVGGAVPVVAALSLPPALTASLAAIVVGLEGVQQLNQWQTDWIMYRSTAEALTHERFLFLACADRYSAADRYQVLAARVEDLVSRENAQWSKSRDRSDQGPGTSVIASLGSAG